MTRPLSLQLMILSLLVLPAIPAPAVAQQAALTISGSPLSTVAVGKSYQFTPSVTGGRSTRRFFWIRGKPDWASFASRTGTLTGTPGSSKVGTYDNIRITVTDGRSTVSLPAFGIAVVAASSAPTPNPVPAPAPTTNRAPIITGSPAANVTVGSPYTFQPTANDPDGDSLTFTIQSKPVWASFSPTTGQLSGTPTATHVGTTSGITIIASDGKTYSTLPPFSLEVLAATTAAVNNPPTVTGTPPTSVVVGQTYSFQPGGSDPDGDVIAYGIANKPAWARFSTTTGRLSGTPSASDVGTTSNVVIAVSDSKSNATLAPFAITVTPGTGGSLTLSWDAPTSNTDGTVLTNLSGYQIQYGTSAAALTQSIRIENPGISTYVVSNLASGTWYFTISAYNTAGTSSPPSSTVMGVIP